MKLYRLSLLFLILICLYPDLTHALFTSEYATFGSFYKESSAIDWTDLAIAGAVAIAVGSVIFFTGGTAGPVVGSIGTWIGGLKGLSGAAATKGGLALLGGGSVASGGLGIAGGTALLTASLTFGTELASEYMLDEAYSEYRYSNLLEQSREMPTLPPPVNSSGSDAYGDAIEILQGIDKKSPMSANSNQRLVAQAISRIETDEESLSENEKIKNRSLLSLLYFMSNGYKEAKGHAQTAIESARDSKIKGTLPAFIYATSSLYEKEFDFSHITNKYFRYSVLKEPDNPLIPLLFLIYLDRMLLRFNDNFLDETALHQIFTIMESPKLEELRVQHYTILLAGYFIRLKLERQKIMTLTNAASNTIKNSPKTLQVVNNSFDRYKALRQGTEKVMSAMLNLDLDDDNSRAQRAEFQSLLLDYAKDEARLASLVANLRTRVVETGASARESVAAGIGLAILAILGVFVWRLRRP